MLAFFPAMRICADAISDLAYSALAGVLLNRLWLGRSESCERPLRSSLRFCSTVLIIVLPLQYLLLSASMIGDTGWTDAWNAARDVGATHSGRAMVASFCFVPCLLFFSMLTFPLKRIRSVLIGLALEAGFIACRAFNGHAASEGDFTLREGVQFLHLCAIATWGGGILVAGWITVPRLASYAGFDSLVRFGKRLSATVSFALVGVILTGIYNSWKGLNGSLSPLVISGWGRMLLLKLFFVSLALLHGIRVRLLQRESTPWTLSRATLMRHWLRTEALFMFVALTCSAWLAHLPPAEM